MDVDMIEPSQLIGVFPTADYSYRMPEPPCEVQKKGMCNPARPPPKGPLIPIFNNLDTSGLTMEDLHFITQNATDTTWSGPWYYENRSDAHAILDFLYLGPTSVVRDYAFMKREQISSVLVVRDARMRMYSASVETASRDLDIPIDYIDITTCNELLQTLPGIIRRINTQVLAAKMSTEPPAHRKGRVLLTCDTGKRHSAFIAAAYIMAVFGQDFQSAWGYVQTRRFSCWLEGDPVRALSIWETLLRARCDVAQNARLQMADARVFAEEPTANQMQKRGLDSLLEMDPESCDIGDLSLGDEERFADRKINGPFEDVSQF